ncbi:MAG: hypothetical protein ACK5MR_13260 [Cumulibacter sp.]
MSGGIDAVAMAAGTGMFAITLAIGSGAPVSPLGRRWVADGTRMGCGIPR